MMEEVGKEQVTLNLEDETKGTVNKKASTWTMIAQEMKDLEELEYSTMESHLQSMQGVTLEDDGKAQELMENYSSSMEKIQQRKGFISNMLKQFKKVDIKSANEDEISEEAHEFHRGIDSTTAPLIIFEIIMILLYVTMTKYEPMETAVKSVSSMFSFYCGISIMIFIGFAYLMTFLRRYGFSAVGYTLLLSVIAIQWGMLVMSFFDHLNHGHVGEKIEIGLSWLIEGHFAAAVVLISFGALIGKCSPLQMFYFTIFEIFFYGLNFHLGVHIMGATDVGGSMVIHAFGAYFGLASTRVLSKKDAIDCNDNGSRYTSDIFAMIGTLFLWIYWPSFNGAFAGDNRTIVAVNTVLSLTGSVLAAFASSRIFRGEHKFDMVDIQNATLAGGVAVGCSADMYIGPGGAMTVGCIAGTLSVVGYVFITPWLQDKAGVQDTCGVHNLHGMPGVLGALVGVVAVSFSSDYDSHQSMVQIGALLVTLGVAIVGGFITSFVISKLTKSPVKYFQDIEDWGVPAQYNLISEEGSLSDVWMMKNE